MNTFIRLMVLLVLVSSSVEARKLSDLIGKKSAKPAPPPMLEEKPAEPEPEPEPIPEPVAQTEPEPAPEQPAVPDRIKRVAPSRLVPFEYVAKKIEEAMESQQKKAQDEQTQKQMLSLLAEKNKKEAQEGESRREIASVPAAQEASFALPFTSLGKSAEAPPPVAEQKIPAKSPAVESIEGVGDVAVILTDNQFFPSNIKLKEGNRVRLLFTAAQKKPAALVIERMQIQRWLASNDKPAPTEVKPSQTELVKELASNRVTEVVLEAPKKGVYIFRDALSGATGELVIE